MAGHVGFRSGIPHQPFDLEATFAQASEEAGFARQFGE